MAILGMILAAANTGALIVCHCGRDQVYHTHADAKKSEVKGYWCHFSMLHCEQDAQCEVIDLDGTRVRKVGP